MRQPALLCLDFGARSIVTGAPLAWGIPWIERERRLGGNGDTACPAEMTAVFMAMGFGAMTALDAAVFTRETKNVALEPSASRSPVILPEFSAARGGATLGIHGAF